MSDAETLLPSQLWKQLSSDRRFKAADAFWADDNAAAEQAEVIATIAHRIKFRMKSVLAMPLEKKTRQLVALPVVSEAVAARLLVAYHLAHQKPMMARFLDELGIPHEEGLIADENLTAPPPERLASAAKALTAAFPSEDVSLYLSTLLWQDPETWGRLADLAEARTVS